jgi:hypothetical protein
MDIRNKHIYIHTGIVPETLVGFENKTQKPT